MEPVVRKMSVEDQGDKPAGRALGGGVHWESGTFIKRTDSGKGEQPVISGNKMNF